MAPRQRKRPRPRLFTDAAPGGDTVTAPQDLDDAEEDSRDEAAATRPVDLEEDLREHGEPDDAPRTEPAALEPPARRRPRRRGT
jgi:hypothetical protein